VLLVPSVCKWPRSCLQTGGRATDLVTGVYEGGLRVWEGSLDLVRYLDAHKDTVLLTQDQDRKKKKCAKKNKKGKSRGGGGRKGGGSGGGNGSGQNLPPLRCLDLGCGHGLPGLYALRAKGSRWRVCFSDFNAEVNYAHVSFLLSLCLRHVSALKSSLFCCLCLNPSFFSIMNYSRCLST